MLQAQIANASAILDLQCSGCPSTDTRTQVLQQAVRWLVTMSPASVPPK